MPCLMEFVGENLWIFLPSISKLPESGVSRPNSKPAVSVRPDPTSPARPRNFPLMKRNVQWFNPVEPAQILRVQNAFLADVLAVSTLIFDISSSAVMVLPIILTTSSIFGKEAVSSQQISFPFRMTVMRSEI